MYAPSSIHKKCNVEKKEKRERERMRGIDKRKAAGDRQVVWKLLIKRGIEWNVSDLPVTWN